MIVIEDVILSDEIKDRHFVCDLSACKGGCCVQGDSGAPLEIDEMEKLEAIYEDIKPYLNEEGIAAIEKQGAFVFDQEAGKMKTPLVKGGACAYVTYENGITKCGIEKAYENGATDFWKPVSCHLYPIRITKYEGYDAVNYEEWNICKAACTLGDKLKVPVYRFVKDALIRKYGAEFYAALEAAIEYADSNDRQDT